MSENGKKWFERITWALIYGGLLMLITGIVAGESHTILGWSLGSVGSLATAAGVVMIYIRSRMK
jgi:hypothetical protein